MPGAKSWVSIWTPADSFHGFLLDKGRSRRSIPGLRVHPGRRDQRGGPDVGDFEPPGHHGFLLDKGTYATIDFPGALATDALGINAAGQIVGHYLDGFTQHGFLLDEGTFTTVDPPGSTFTEAIGINAAGQIVGDYMDASGTQHGFLVTP